MRMNERNWLCSEVETFNKKQKKKIEIVERNKNMWEFLLIQFKRSKKWSLVLIIIDRR